MDDGGSSSCAQLGRASRRTAADVLIKLRKQNLMTRNKKVSLCTVKKMKTKTKRESRALYIGYSM